MPVRKSAKSLKQLSLEYVTQHLGDYYERYKDCIQHLDVVSPFDPLCKYITAFFLDYNLLSLWTKTILHISIFVLSTASQLLEEVNNNRSFYIPSGSLKLLLTPKIQKLRIPYADDEKNVATLLHLANIKCSAVNNIFQLICLFSFYRNNF